MVDLVRRLGVALAAPVLAAAVFGSAQLHAQDFDDRVLKTGQFEGNIIVGGEIVDVDAIVTGDVVAAGSEITIEDSVEGDVLAVGKEVTVRGTVLGDVRVAAMIVEMRAAAGGDIMAAGRDVRVAGESTIGGSAWLAGETIDVDGALAGPLKAAGRNININGEIGDDVELAGETIVVGPTAHITGDLTYRSLDEADIHADARIDGDVTFIRSEGPDEMMGGTFAGFGGAGVVFWLGLIVLGGILIAVFPGLSGAARQHAHRSMAHPGPWARHPRLNAHPARRAGDHDHRPADHDRRRRPLCDGVVRRLSVGGHRYRPMGGELVPAQRRRSVLAAGGRPRRRARHSGDRRADPRPGCTGDVGRPDDRVGHGRQRGRRGPIKPLGVRRDVSGDAYWAAARAPSHLRMRSPSKRPNVSAGISDMPPTKPLPDKRPKPRTSPAA